MIGGALILQTKCKQEIQMKLTPKPVEQVIFVEEKPVVKENFTTASGAIKLYKDNTNNCVAWAKQRTGINRPLGYGARNAIQGDEPRIGAIGSTKGGTPHAVVVVAINGDYLTVNESNYTSNYVTQRVLRKNDFIGFVYY